MPQFIAIQPVLPARNVTEAINFYVNNLGFELAFKDSNSDPNYAGMRRGDIDLHLQWHDEKSFEQVERLQIRFVVSNVDNLFAEYKDQDFVGMNESPEKTTWGTFEFSFFDLNSNALIFYQDL